MSSIARPARLVGTNDPALEMSRPSLAVNGAATLLVLYLALALNRLQLPHDQEFNAVIYLMWSSDQPHQWIVFRALMILLAIATALGVLLIAGALIYPRGNSLYQRLVLRARHDGLQLSIWLLLALNLSRYVATFLYEVAQHVTWDVTPRIARVEASFITALQAYAGHEIVSEIAAWLYSVGWYLPILLAGPLAQALGRKGLLPAMSLATLLTAVLAVPMFIALPTFEPWAMNAWYGYDGPGAVAVTYAYPGADSAALRYVATELRWATGACLPSLHVAFPLAYGLVLTRAGQPRLAAPYWLLAGLTAIGVLILGRHWIIDVVIAAPYAMVVAVTTELVLRAVGLDGDNFVKGTAPERRG